MDCNKSLLLIIVLFQVFSWPAFAGEIGGSNQGAEQDAEELFNQAVTILNKARNEAEDYKSILALYRKAQEKVDSIISGHPHSNLAVALVSGQRKLSGYSLERFLKRGQFLEILSAAENDPMFCTLALSGRISNPPERSNAISNLPNALLRVKLFNEALRWGNQNTGTLIRARHFADIGEREKASRLIFQALEVYRNQRNQSSVGFLEDIAENYVLAGEKEKVRELLVLLREAVMGRPELAEASRERYRIETALEKISIAFAESGYFEEALDLAVLIRESRRIYAITKIAREYFAKGETIKAAQLREQAKNLIDSLDEDDDWMKPTELRTLAVSYAKTGQFSEALATVELLEGESDKYSVLSRIAGECFRAGKREEAFHLQDRALEIVKALYPDDLGRGDSAHRIADPYIENGLYDEALGVADSFIAAEGKTYIYLQMAESNIRSGEIAKADQLIERAVGLVLEIEHSMDKKGRLKWVIGLLAETGNKELLSRLLEITQNIDRPWDRAELMGLIAEAYSELGEFDKASKMFSIALNTVKEISGDFEIHRKCDALAEIGAGYYIAGLQLKEEDKAVLRELVLKAYPLESFWDLGSYNRTFFLWYLGLFPPSMDLPFAEYPKH